MSDPICIAPLDSDYECEFGESIDGCQYFEFDEEKRPICQHPDWASTTLVYRTWNDIEKEKRLSDATDKEVER